MVEGHQSIGQQENSLRQVAGRRQRSQVRLELADRLIAQEAYQPADEARQPLDVRRLVLRQLGLEHVQHVRAGGQRQLGDAVRPVSLHRARPQAVLPRGLHPYERIARHPLAALHRLEQERRPGAAQL